MYYDSCNETARFHQEINCKMSDVERELFRVYSGVYPVTNSFISYLVSFLISVDLQLYDNINLVQYTSSNGKWTINAFVRVPPQISNHVHIQGRLQLAWPRLPCWFFLQSRVKKLLARLGTKPNNLRSQFGAYDLSSTAPILKEDLLSVWSLDPDPGIHYPQES